MLNKDAVNRLNSLQTNSSILEAIRTSGGRLNEKSLPELREFCRTIGYEPSVFDRLNVIHIAGTKGKGSTSAFVDSILRHFNQSGDTSQIRLFTSPHLVTVRERIRLNGNKISEEMFAKYFFECWDKLYLNKKKDDSQPNMPNYFRFLTLMAFHVFMNENVDVAILETGVGGEYDSTNIIERPIVCGVTSLGIDHQRTLGDTIESISWHKGGIFKKNVPAITAEQPASGFEILRKRASEINAPFIPINSLSEEMLDELRINLGLAGKHQFTNASLAIELCRIWLEKQKGIKLTEKIPKEFIPGLVQVSWPGRSQVLKLSQDQGITWYFDGAHTSESTQACIEWFKDVALKTDDEIERILVFNSTRDGMEILKQFTSTKPFIKFDHAIFCTNITFLTNKFKPDLQNNSIKIDENLTLQKQMAENWSLLNSKLDDPINSQTHVFSTIEGSINWIREHYQQTKKEIQVLTTGSLHLVGGVMAVLDIDVL
ncbi:2181_t:CDS:10 [Funneliformis geosporum]|uniref:Folylpolyglutamate synthase n=1 Tax=Funneliformis geosporum TaxID=1117311 RepID=A0A9W4STX9_9GLOM|nr:2181_t:CDS:10 [Funneliformis geosporum]CAI2180526.1 552_t:CDS:10 [Funneliformis geosporum]